MDKEGNQNRADQKFSLIGFIDSKKVFYDAETHANLVNLTSESGVIVHKGFGNINIVSAMYKNSETDKTKTFSLNAYRLFGKKSSLIYVLRKN